MKGAKVAGWATGAGSSLASFMFTWAMIRPYLPYHLELYLAKYWERIFRYFDPYINIRIHEYAGERLFQRSELFTAVQSYLAAITSQSAKRLKAEMGRDSKNLTISMDEYEMVKDEYRGAKLEWSSYKIAKQAQSSSSYHQQEVQMHYYCLRVHKRHRQLVTDHYLPHVMKEGKANKVRNRQRKLYTNSRESYSYRNIKEWSHVVFEHPATFQTLAMDPEKKQDIIDDLTTFIEAKNYYAKIGKAWKRGYLLYGPPGTGKSTMIAAMANFLDYDIYDLELTAVKDNMELRKLLIETTSKSIIVIEDIDCSLDMSIKRRKKDKESTDKETDHDENSSKVTLSGLLNFIDGLWSACGGERLIVITTNHVEKLDPALIRRGRMDKHIELSYCSFEGFKVLAKSYLDLDSHPLFESIQQLMEETTITPADVAENLMPKSSLATAENVTCCLKNLIHALEMAKEAALRLKDDRNRETAQSNDKMGIHALEKAKEEASRLQDDRNRETAPMDNSDKMGIHALEKAEEEASGLKDDRNRGLSQMDSNNKMGIHPLEKAKGEESRLKDYRKERQHRWTSMIK